MRVTASANGVATISALNTKWHVFCTGYYPAIASATMPPLIPENIYGILHLQSNTIEYVWLSNDRPNIHLMVTEMQHSFLSEQDLNRFIKFDHASLPEDTSSCLPKFMIFTNKWKEAENMAKKFWQDLPQELHHMVVWFHSGMKRQWRSYRRGRLGHSLHWCSGNGVFWSKLSLPKLPPNPSQPLTLCYQAQPLLTFEQYQNLVENIQGPTEEVWIFIIFSSLFSMNDLSK